MPNPSLDQLEKIQENARGTLPNTPPPETIGRDGITNLQLIAFNELFEVAFFNELLLNVTNNVEGYHFKDPDDREFVITTLTAILAQEELHVLSANSGLQHFNIASIQPCRYQFPVSDFDSAIALAATFTNLVLGTLQDVVEVFAAERDFGLARLIASVIGNEGEQQGWFRIQQGKIPSELPFLTTSALPFAFTAVQQFTVPGSCLNINEIKLQTFQPLTIVKTPSTMTGNIIVSWPVSKQGTRNQTPFSLTYINQQNLPIVEPLQITSRKENVVYAEALFPYDQYELNGFTIAAITNSSGPFPNAGSVARSTVFGPGLIMVN
ncbi:putative sexual development protein [Talaromyces proteolyticus]|uniref:Sexual development protein n=1 Tax=Talaromyces proteolyticus TaxID=1131652 RepID=A0AAD4KV80_9EURO|nr:putative sexual development protein [Talaromyces proteolyticus]KAH8700203.1 putative sexual development protein [Talaromyces proteolyticus]